MKNCKSKFSILSSSPKRWRYRNIA